MPKITWRVEGKGEITADVKNGSILMQAAVDNGVPFVIGECGGNLSCATCHVQVDDSFWSKVGPPGGEEDLMLDCTEAERRAKSRLSCQLKATDELDGLILHVPDPLS